FKRRHYEESFTCQIGICPSLQVDVWSSKSDLLPAGYYQANSGIDDKSLSPLVQKTAGRIAELYDHAVLIMVRDCDLDHEIWMIGLDNRKIMWSDWESSRHICKSLLEAKAYSQLVDFDAHLDDIREDWTNQQLNTEIAQLVSVANGSA
ncbi:hypothetical protein JD844_000955, partial [Phrynosoma platyrhinos]